MNFPAISKTIVNYISKEYSVKINNQEILKILKMQCEDIPVNETKETEKQIKRKIKKPNKYKFRAECKTDVDKWMELKTLVSSVVIINDPDGLPDVEVEFDSCLTIDELRRSFKNSEAELTPQGFFKKCIDGHVMLESLNYSHKYTGDRYYYEDEKIPEESSRVSDSPKVFLNIKSELKQVETPSKIYDYLILNTGYTSRLIDATVDNGEFKNSFSDLLTFVSNQKFGEIIGISDNSNIFALKSNYIGILKSFNCIDNGCIIFKINKTIIDINDFIYKYCNTHIRHCSMLYTEFQTEISTEFLYTKLKTQEW